MPLPLIVESLDTIPEAFRGEYAEKDGKFRLNVEGIEDTTGLRSALAAERKTAKEAVAKVKKWEALGKTDEEIADLLKKHAEQEEELAKKSGNFDALLAQHQKKWSDEKGALETELQAARASERKAIIETSVTTALTKAKATTEGLDLLTERLGKRINFETVDGKRVIQITQADGKTPMAGAGADGLATFDDLVKEAMKSYPSLFEGLGGGGGGTSPKGSGGAGNKTITRDAFFALAPAEQAAKIKAGFTVVDKAA